MKVCMNMNLLFAYIGSRESLRIGKEKKFCGIFEHLSICERKIEMTGHVSVDKIV